MAQIKFIIFKYFKRIKNANHTLASTMRACFVQTYYFLTFQPCLINFVMQKNHLPAGVSAADELIKSETAVMSIYY